MLFCFLDVFLDPTSTTLKGGIGLKDSAACPRLYRFNDEDDYPYFPRKLGACDIGWNFQTGSVAGGIF